MNITKYFFTMIAAAGLSLGTLAMAQETGVQSRCSLLAAAGGLPIDLFEWTEDDSPAEAFCVGLQSHGDEFSLVRFGDGYSVYDDSNSQTIMAKNVEYYSGGHGLKRCLPTFGPIEACNEDHNSALQLKVPDHPDYLAPEFSGSTTYVNAWAQASFGAGSLAGMTTGRNARINLYGSGTYNIKKLTIDDYGEIHLNAGDYFIETLRMDPHSKIIVDGPGTARLFLKNQPSLGIYSRMNWRKDPSKLVVVANHFTGSRLSIAAYIYAHGIFALADYSIVEGAVNAANISLWNHSTVDEKLSSIANVNFGELTSIPAPYDPSLFEGALSNDRHSGTYTLDYSFAAEEQHIFDPDDLLLSGYFNDLEGELEIDEMLVGSIFGGIIINVAALPPLPLLFQIPVPIARLNGAENLTLAIQRDEKIEEFQGFLEAGNCEGSNPQTGEPFWCNVYLPDSYESKILRDAAVEDALTGFTDEVAVIYQKIEEQWNLVFNFLPKEVAYQTVYPLGNRPNQGLAVFGYDNQPGGWVSVLNDNMRVTVPVYFPVSGIYVPIPLGVMTPSGPLVGLAVVGCSAWVAALEVGCFKREDGEACPDINEDDECDNECKQSPYIYNDPQPVDAAFHAAVGAQLWCTAGVLPYFAITATVGFGFEALPVGRKQ